MHSTVAVRKGNCYVLLEQTSYGALMLPSDLDRTPAGVRLAQATDDYAEQNLCAAAHIAYGQMEQIRVTTHATPPDSLEHWRPRHRRDEG